jgi:hypothetical protein
LTPSALFPICYPHHQHANIREKDEWYKECGWKVMLRMKLIAECKKLGIQGRKFGRVLLPLLSYVKMTPLGTILCGEMIVNWF